MFMFLFVLFLCVIYENTAKDLATKCRCVPEDMCLDDDPNLNGHGLLDIRMADHFCTDYNEVCCENPASPENLKKESLKDTTTFKGCGFSSAVQFRITSESTETLFAELPWTLILLHYDKELNQYQYKCGASLIHPRAAITAAHCIGGFQLDVLTLRAGEWNAMSDVEPLPTQTIPVQEVVLHPRYKSSGLHNDIAILFTREPFRLAENVGTVCLPPPQYTFPVNTRCLASGWGLDAFRTGSYSNILKKIEVPIAAKDQCLKKLRQTRLGPFFKLHRSFLCAGGEEGRDTCSGDGGSPLVCSTPEFKGRFVQTGIVAWGIGCGEANLPGVYVNLAMFRDWIDMVIEGRGLESSYYDVEATTRYRGFTSDH